MRIVVDTNQVLAFGPSVLSAFRGAEFQGITVPPWVFAELVNRRYLKPSVDWIKEFDYRAGLDEFQMFPKVAALRCSQIECFEPFEEPDSWICRKIETGLQEPLDELERWARKATDTHRRFTKGLKNAFQKARTEARKHDFRSKFEDMADALEEMGEGPGSFFGSLISTYVTDARRRPVLCSDSEQLQRSVLNNPFISRFFRALFCYALCLSKAWNNQELNFSPRENENLVTDVSLFLYAADGDVIASAETKIAKVAGLIDPNLIGTWKHRSVVKAE